MILSVSRRTDIPALYMDWFLNRLSEGYVRVQNPMNRKQVREIAFSDVDLIVFWTKNPEFILKHHKLIKRPFFLQLTITPYNEYEERLDKSQVIDHTISLSKIIGKERIIWRYDPIIVNDLYTVDHHLQAFEELCQQLHCFVDHIIISTYQDYRHLNIDHNQFETYALVSELSNIAKKYNLTMQACVSNTSVKQGSCLDADYLYRVFSLTGLKEDKNQRKGCHCVESIDIGAYSTCIHGCKYCYAVKSFDQAQKYYHNHKNVSDHLGMDYQGDETIKRVIIDRQIKLGGI